MIGEMHGTNEPFEFAYGICKLISQKEEKSNHGSGDSSITREKLQRFNDN